MKENRIIPKLRTDLVFNEYSENGQDFIILYDPHGYAPRPVSIPQAILPFFRMIDGETSLAGFREKITEIYGDQAPLILEPLINLINFLDLAGYLESDNYRELKNEIDSYMKSPVRPPVCSGNSYPADPEELADEIKMILGTVPEDKIKPGARALAVPHIDFRIGNGAHKVYAAGYHSIRDNDADLFVIFGTAHYGNSAHFMLSEKDFETPSGIVETDKELLALLKKNASDEFVIDEMAHKNEHSVELQLVLLQHYFNGRDFKILPVLTGSFHDYMMNGSRPSEDKHFISFITALNESINSLGRKALFIASGDLAHIGRKFDDNFDASPQLERLKTEDKVLIELLEKCDFENFYKNIADKGDSNKICGLSPFYSLLYASKPGYAKFLKYHQWDETETKSAVSFASIAFYK